MALPAPRERGTAARHRRLVGHRRCDRPRARQPRPRRDPGRPARGAAARAGRRARLRARRPGGGLRRRPRRALGPRASWPSSSSGSASRSTLLVNNAGFGYAGDFVDSRARAPGGDGRAQLRGGRRPHALASCPGWSAAAAGAIINIASTAAFQPMPKSATYARDQGLRPQLQRGHPQRARRHRRDGDRGLPGPGEDRVHGRVAGSAAPRRTCRDIFWHSAEDIARGGSEGRGGRQARGRPRAAQPRGHHARPLHAAHAVAAAHEAACGSQASK